MYSAATPASTKRCEGARRGAVDPVAKGRAIAAPQLPGRDDVADQRGLVAGHRELALVVFTGDSAHAREIRLARGEDDKVTEQALRDQIAGTRRDNEFQPMLPETTRPMASR
jgi:hypothetical protein